MERWRKVCKTFFPILIFYSTSVTLCYFQFFYFNFRKIAATQLENFYWQKYNSFFSCFILRKKGDITHYVKNKFVRIQKVDWKMFGWCLCQKKLWYFYLWIHGLWRGQWGSARGWNNRLRGGEVLGHVRLDRF